MARRGSRGRGFKRNHVEKRHSFRSEPFAEYKEYKLWNGWDSQYRSKITVPEEFDLNEHLEFIIRKFFPNRKIDLSDKKISAYWANDMTETSGVMRPLYKDEGNFSTYDSVIWMNSRLLSLRPKSDTFSTLVHETVHAVLWLEGVDEEEEHGPIFKQEIRRIFNQQPRIFPNLKRICHNWEREVEMVRRMDEVVKDRRAEERSRQELTQGRPRESTEGRPREPTEGRPRESKEGRPRQEPTNRSPRQEPTSWAEWKKEREVFGRRTETRQRTEVRQEEDRYIQID